MRKNIIIDTDSYKRVHWKMLRPGLTKLYAYGEPRSGGRYSHVSFIGPQMIVADHFLQPVTNEMIEEAEWRSISTFGTDKYFNKEVWQKVRDLGYLPIKIMTAPEGMKIREGNVCFTIESTVPWFANTVNALEDILMHTWYPTAVATRSMRIKERLKPLFEKSSKNPSVMLLFAVNDFGLRGATCHEAAARGGVGHLLHFAGSDNEVAQTALYDYYQNRDRLKSVWATEHSVALSWGITDMNEIEYLKWQLQNSEPHLIISNVIDTKNSDGFMQKVVGNAEIVQMIKDREGRVVFRPDSGDPLTNILKYLDILANIFGFSVHNGYRILNHNVGLIQSDGMDEDTIVELYENVMKAGWSADNFVTGSGGGLLQVGLSRDTSRWAIKPSYMEFGEQKINVQKIPATDMSKASKPGLLKLHRSYNNENGDFMTVSSAELLQGMFEGYIDSLRVLLEDGNYFPESFDKILKRADLCGQDIILKSGL